jgi:protein SDA1
MLFFKLFLCPDKELRTLMYSHIVSDIKSINLKSKDKKLNRVIQNFMFEAVEDKNDVFAKKALDVMIELYTKGLWCGVCLPSSSFFFFPLITTCRNDTKTVNAIGKGVFSKNSKTLVAALKFFLTPPGGDEDSDDDSSVCFFFFFFSLSFLKLRLGACFCLASKQEKLKQAKQIVHSLNNGSKKTRSKARKVEKAIAKLKKKTKKKPEQFNFKAVELLHDPDSTHRRLLPFPFALLLFPSSFWVCLLLTLCCYSVCLESAELP